MLSRKFVGALIAVIALLGCDSRDMETREEVLFAKQFFSMVQARDLPGIETKLDSRLKDQNIRSAINQIASDYLDEPPKEIGLVSYNSFSFKELHAIRD